MKVRTEFEEDLGRGRNASVRRQRCKTESVIRNRREPAVIDRAVIIEQNGALVCGLTAVPEAECLEKEHGRQEL
jgi:hypothetical protein